MTYTWVETINGIFAAHRSGDMVAKKFWEDVWAEIDTMYADTMDAIDA